MSAPLPIATIAMLLNEARHGRVDVSAEEMASILTETLAWRYIAEMRVREPFLETRPPQPSAHEDPLLAVVPEAWVPSRDAAIRNAARHEERAKPYRGRRREAGSRPLG